MLSRLFPLFTNQWGIEERKKRAPWKSAVPFPKGLNKGEGYGRDYLSPFFTLDFDQSDLRTILFHPTVLKKNGSGGKSRIFWIMGHHDDRLPVFIKGFKQLHDLFSCFGI